MPGSIEGTIASVSEAGNLVTDIPADRLSGAPKDESVAVLCDGHETNGIFDSNHDQPAATLLAVIGPSGCLELEVVGENAQMMLGVRVGERVEVRW